MSSNNNIVSDRITPGKQFPSQNAMYAGWEVSDKDLVNYNDAQRRGLLFLFSVYRKAPDAVIESPLNKYVSVYQKNEEGDFVIVSISGNNPNDIRLMEMTNEYYGDPDPDPMELIMRTIEMADDSGTLRSTEGYGKYGMLETASDGDTFNRFSQAVGLDAEPSSEKSSSIITRTLGTKVGEKIGNIIKKVGSMVLGTAAGKTTQSVHGGQLVDHLVKGAPGSGKTKKPTSKGLAEKKEELAAKGSVASELEKQKHQQKLEQMEIGYGHKKNITELGKGIYGKDTSTKHHQTQYALGLAPKGDTQDAIKRTSEAYRMKPGKSKPATVPKQSEGATYANPFSQAQDVSYGSTTVKTGTGRGKGKTAQQPKQPSYKTQKSGTKSTFKTKSY